MKKFYLFKIFFLVLAISPLNVAVSDEVKLKIGVVDMQKLESEALVFKDLDKKMKAKEKDLHQDLINRKNKIENDFKALESKRSVLSGEELQKKAKKLELDYQKLQIDEKLYLQTFDMARAFALQQIQGDVKKAVNKVADKYDLIFPLNLTLYVNEEKFDNLSSKVIDKLNGIIKTIDFEKSFKDAKGQLEEIVKGNQQKKNAKK